jgi:hypothetical protein
LFYCAINFCAHFHVPLSLSLSVAPPIAPFPSATPLHTNNTLFCRTVVEQSIATLLISVLPSVTECKVNVFSKDYPWTLIISNRMLYTHSHCTSLRNILILSPIKFQYFQVGSSCDFADYNFKRLYENTRTCYMSFLLTLFCLITPDTRVLD